MSWNEAKLIDVCLKITDGSHFSPAEQESGCIMLSSKDMDENGFDYSDVKYISESDYLKLVKNDCKPLKNDILIIKDGNSYLKRIFLCKEEKEQVVLSSIAIVRPNIEKVLPDFLTYYLKSSRVKNEMALFLSGAAIPRIILDDFKKVKIKLPPLPVQRRIAEVLGRYDALIENYNTQIGILEASAQALYRERIVNYELRIKQQTGKLPVGWEQATLDKIATENRRIVKVKDLIPTTPYVGLEHLSIKSIVIKDCGTVEDIDSDKLIFNKHDILFCKIRPYLHKVCLSHFKGVCSSDTIVIKPSIENALGFLMFTVFDEKFIEFADKVSNGTKMPRAEWSVLRTYNVTVPSDKTLAAFDKVVLPIFAKIENLQSQIAALRMMRDKLLPRLLSGKIDVAA